MSAEADDKIVGRGGAVLAQPITKGLHPPQAKPGSAEIRYIKPLVAAPGALADTDPYQQTGTLEGRFAHAVRIGCLTAESRPRRHLTTLVRRPAAVYRFSQVLR